MLLLTTRKKKVLKCKQAKCRAKIESLFSFFDSTWRTILNAVILQPNVCTLDLLQSIVPFDANGDMQDCQDTCDNTVHICGICTNAISK